MAPCRGGVRRLLAGSGAAEVIDVVVTSAEWFIGAGQPKYRLRLADGVNDAAIDAFLASALNTLGAALAAAGPRRLRITAHRTNHVQGKDVVAVLEAQLLEEGDDDADAAADEADVAKADGTACGTHEPARDVGGAGAHEPARDAGGPASNRSSAPEEPARSEASRTSAPEAPPRTEPAGHAATEFRSDGPASNPAEPAISVAGRPAAPEARSDDVVRRIAANRQAALAKLSLSVAKKRAAAAPPGPVDSAAAAVATAKKGRQAPAAAAEQRLKRLKRLGLFGCAAVDSALGACLVPGTVSECSGAAGVGKSNLAHTIVALQLLRDKTSRVLIVRSGPSCTRRAMAIAVARRVVPARFGSGVLVSTALDASALLDRLATATGMDPVISLVVVDSIADVLRGSNRKSRASDLAKLLGGVEKLRDRGSAVLLVNQAAADFGSNDSKSLVAVHDKAFALLANVPRHPLTPPRRYRVGPQRGARLRRARPRFSLSRSRDGRSRELTVSTAERNEEGDLPSSLYVVTHAGIADAAEQAAADDGQMFDELHGTQGD